MPPTSWSYYQEWNRAIFLHWKVDGSVLRKLVPAALEIDQIEGYPWVSLVAFTMEKIRPRYLPPFPPISNFFEINIRTYVKSGDKTGVYFLSIEGGKRLSCQIARALSELPYRYSQMKRASDSFYSSNEEYGDSFKIRFEIGKSLKQKSETDEWLTERYALFQDANSSINSFDIHHVQWPIQSIQIHDLQVHYPRFEKLFQGTPDLVHYSPGVQVIAWDKVRLWAYPP